MALTVEKNKGEHMPYSKFDPDQMILRDHLAYDRTVLSNERTFAGLSQNLDSITGSRGNIGEGFSR